MSTRRVTEHKKCTLDGEELQVLTVWETGIDKEKIKKLNPYCKTQEILINHNGFYEFREKRA